MVLMVNQALERDRKDLRRLPQIFAIGSEPGKLFVKASNEGYLLAHHMTGDFSGPDGRRSRGPRPRAPPLKRVGLG